MTILLFLFAMISSIILGYGVDVEKMVFICPGFVGLIIVLVIAISREV